MKKCNHYLALAGCLLFSGIFLSSCSKDELAPQNPELVAGQVSQQKTAASDFFALTDNNMVVRFSGGNTVKEMGAVALSGLASGELMLAMDFRPATGQLYGVSNMSRIYVINQHTGVTTVIGASAFSPAINGTQVGFDFNPTVDRIRLVTNTTQNLRLNPETGQVAAIDGNLNPNMPEVTAVAYTNSMAGASSTTLYDIDVKTDKLYIQNPPNSGGLVEVGRLNVQTVGEAGFDISPDNSMALAVLFGRGGGTTNQGQASPGNSYRFYSIDLATGKATNIGNTDRNLIGVAISTNPVAYAVDAANNLLIFNPEMANTVVMKPITGLASGEKVLGIDMRPATSQLFALGSSSQIYAVNMASGVFTAIGLPFSPALSGTQFGFDFNPTVDRIRVVSNTGQNLRLHPGTGQVAFVDGTLNPGTPSIDAAAYTNNMANATSTSLYTIDFATDGLYLQSPPNAGSQTLIGALGISVEANNGFDIGGTTGKAMALLQSGGQSGIYHVNLGSGQATMVSAMSGSPESFAIGLGF